MKSKLMIISMACIASTLTVLPSYAGNSTAGTKIGVLTCSSVPNSGVNLIIHSTVDITCTFESTDGSGVENYIGETGIGFGINASYEIEKHMLFTVFAADTVSGSHKLAGKYGGVGASASIGVGVGAQVLVGGSNKSVSLQPVLEGNTGVGVSAGITYLYLQAK
ncbi:DUF992 domain-containing protein [Mariprofundus ferrooxydans]|nr:DUF992 domain-containing protein [Mariprofundus ferrooxydans]